MDGDRQDSIEWTMEHHKKFVDIVVGLGGFSKIGTPRIVVAEMMNTVEGLSQRTLVHHMVLFQLLNKRTQLSLGRRTTQPKQPCSDSYQSLVSNFEGLHVAPPKRLLSSWTVEHHMRVVEAVTKLGGLSKATPTAVLRLMEEARRQGLNIRTLRRHLSGLRYLQKKTQPDELADCDEWAGPELDPFPWPVFFEVSPLVFFAKRPPVPLALLIAC